MRATGTLVAITSAVVVAGLLVWQLLHRDDASSARAGAGASSPAISEREVLALRAEVASLRNQVRAMHGQPADVPATRAEPASAADVPDEAEPAPHPYADVPPELLDQAIEDDLQAFVQSEAIDETWRAATAALVTAAVRETRGAELVSVDCRSTLCRVELAHAEGSERESAVHELTMKLPFNTQGFVYVPISNPGKSVIYFARSGHHLPDPQ
jgi:hypothetical protein